MTTCSVLPSVLLQLVNATVVLCSLDFPAFATIQTFPRSSFRKKISALEGSRTGFEPRGMDSDLELRFNIKQTVLSSDQLLALSAVCAESRSTRTLIFSHQIFGEIEP